MSLVPANSVFEWDHHDCIRSVNDHCLCLRYDNVTLGPLLLLTGAQAEWGLRYRIYLCLWSSLSLYHSHRPGPYWLSTYVTINAYVSSLYVFSCVICFRFIHFILISTAHALFSGFYLWNGISCTWRSQYWYTSI
jgi:hypothetical protein